MQHRNTTWSPGIPHASSCPLRSKHSILRAFCKDLAPKRFHVRGIVFIPHGQLPVLPVGHCRDHLPWASPSSCPNHSLLPPLYPPRAPSLYWSTILYSCVSQRDSHHLWQQLSNSRALSEHTLHASGKWSPVNLREGVLANKVLAMSSAWGKPNRCLLMEWMSLRGPQMKLLSVCSGVAFSLPQLPVYNLNLFITLGKKQYILYSYMHICDFNNRSP